MKYLVLVLSLFVLAACKKEDRIERNLTNKGGEWHISTYTVKYTTYNPSYPGTEFENYKDCGTFKFENGGQFRSELNINGNTSFSVGSFAVTSNELILTINQTPATYKMTWNKDNLSLERTMTWSDTQGHEHKHHSTFRLRKK